MPSLGVAPGIRGEKACLSIDVNGSQPRLELSGALPLPTPIAPGWAGCCISCHQVLREAPCVGAAGEGPELPDLRCRILANGAGRAWLEP